MENTYGAISNNQLSSDVVRDDGVDSVDEEVDFQDDEIDLVNEHDLQGEELIPSDGRDSSQNSNEDKEIVEKPYFGMEFSSDESAHRYYGKFGEQNGFSVRKQRRSRNKNGLVTRLVFVCSKEGFRKEDRNREKSFSKPISRVGCKAQMSCRLRRSTGKFRVVSFCENHNHELVKTPMKHKPKGSHCMSKAQTVRVNDADLSEMSVKGPAEPMSREVGSRENLGFMDNHCGNYIHRKRFMKMKKGDAGAICQYFQKKSEENSGFFYSLQLDEDDMITNVFWADERSVSDYGLFGDVLCFDTTYQTNVEFGRPFAQFVGVNHHKQTVVFGSALLYDETIESFKWLFETFLGAMKADPPKTILTDQSAAMTSAIKQVFPASHHRHCAWHIYQNAPRQLSRVFHGSEQFPQDLSKCLYDYEDEDDWLLAWNNMLEKHNLKENPWLTHLFNVREKWALVYGRHTFTADMMSAQHSEGMNSVLKEYLKPSRDLVRFFECYDRYLKDRRYGELVADFKMLQTSSLLFANVEMLEHAEEVYTPEMFKLFQEEYKRIFDYVATKVNKSGTQYEYRVSYRGTAQEHLVKYDGSMQTVCCSCMKFSFVGILCRHALRVLDKKNVRRIPSCYILNRWSKEAKARTITSYHTTKSSGHPKESTGKRYSHLCRNFCAIASYAAEHELLTTYAHEFTIELLKKLEEKKKDILKADGSGAIQTLEAEALLDQDGREANNSEITTACGVKRKATFGLPHGSGESNGLFGKKRPESSKAPEEIQVSFRDSIQNLDMQQGIIHAVPVAPISTQVSYIGTGTTLSSFGMHANLDHTSFTRLSQGALMQSGHFSQSNEQGKDPGC